ncbi:patatin-like phospholipase family protein [Rheinheimera sp. UJ51]|uniref:patatin-like phospholipase family protein n=1 Tax=Rheinheimera sp. UJ51 TaxID=2892446 RepID=UPI001E59A46B|nr:patatin-like phospholipase family protein [Rheinheimera sp. UJ51]MCC5451946.1 patatin-like phospholipase family protein [Rheinheimera sp. UJ51]
MQRPLRVLAGQRAFTQIQQQGLHADDISVMIGASGGPKWFCLYGLDQYLLTQFFKNRSKPLHLLGSSAGAWRFACYAQQDGAAASSRFAQAYSEIRFPPQADIKLITQISQNIIKQILPDKDSIQQVLQHPVMKLNLIVDRAKGLNRSNRPWLQGTGLMLAAGANLLNRRLLRHFFQRIHFHVAGEAAPFFHSADLPTEHVLLNEHNLSAAVIASGAIPMVLEPVLDIQGAGQGHYFDGGITDYHFNQQFSSEGLVLYPHFYPDLTPGWFDKGLKWRRANRAYLDNVVILCPSPAWISSLPHGKIPDRKDFKLNEPQRIQAWQTVLSRSHELADAFASGQYQLERL